MIDGLRYRMVINGDKTQVELWDGSKWEPSVAVGLFQIEADPEKSVELYIPNDEEEA